MEIEKIGDPIRVLCDCTGGEIRPLRFRWAGRDYEVETVNAKWIDRQGEVYSLHYSLQVGGQTYWIHFDGREVQWWLDEIALN